jgi:iron complex outermembrane receptor protein
MTMNKHAGRSFLILCLMTGGATHAFAAQETPAAEENREEPPVDEDEIVVTAQLREQSLQDVPISIDVLGAEEIADKKIDDIADIGNEAPGLSVYSFVPRQVNPSIRGAASLNDSPGVDQSVAMFLDGVYIGQVGFFSLDLFDVERIEVLKGPQGTLFGRNVTGGALSIVTTRPPEAFDATLEATLGKYEQKELQGVVGGPLTDSLAGQIAFSWKDSDGFYENTFDGDDVEGRNTFSVRGKLRYNFSDAAEVVLSAEYGRDKLDGIGFDLEGDPLPYMGTEAFGADDEVTLNTPGELDNKTWAYTGTINVDTSIGTITSITAYRKAENFIEFDIDGTPVVQLVARDDDRIKQFSQELRLTGEVDNLQYVGGLYYLNINHQRTEDRLLDGFPGSTYDLFLAPPGGPNPNLTVQGQDIETKSYAAYAEVTYTLGGLSLTGGIRYTKDEKSGTSFCTTEGADLFCPPPAATVEHDGSWDAFTPRFVAQYEFNDDVMVYGSFSRGFKSGGFPLNIFDPDPQADFEPEYANNYEVGLKSRFWGRRLQANIALFQLDFTDLQVLQQSPEGLIFAANAGKARTRGVEIDLNARVTDGLNLYGNYTHLDAEFKSLEIEGADLSGKEPRATPKHAFNVGGTYTLDLGNAGDLTLRANMLYKSRYFLSVDNDPNRTAKVDGLVNAGIEYALPGGQWEFSLWVKNLTDERFFLTKADRGTFIQRRADRQAGDRTWTGRYNEPRTFGATVRWNY